MNPSEMIISVSEDRKLELPQEIQDQLRPGEQYAIFLTEDSIIFKKIQKSSTWTQLSERIEAQGEDFHQPTLQEISKMVKEMRQEKRI